MDLPQEDADIFRLGTAGRQGEDFLQLPAKMRTHHRFPEVPDLDFLESALVRRQSVALKTIIPLHQFHPGYRLMFGSRFRGLHAAASPSICLLYA
ncbi:MAG: hypothetical protein ACREC0_05245 [Methylocella sp.]